MIVVSLALTICGPLVDGGTMKVVPEGIAPVLVAVVAATVVPS